MQNRIKEMIVKSKVPQVELAKRLGMTTVALSIIINSKMPKIDTITKIANALGVPPWSMILSDDEINQIINERTGGRHSFACPACGASLKVVQA